MRNLTIHRIVVVCAFALVASACGDDGPIVVEREPGTSASPVVSSTVPVPSTTSATTPVVPAAAQDPFPYAFGEYSSLLGHVAPRVNSYEEPLDGFVSEYFVGTGKGTLVLYRRGVGSEREDLVLVFDDGMSVVDTLLFGEGTDSAYLSLSCLDNAVGLFEGAEPQPSCETVLDAIRVWKLDDDGLLEVVRSVAPEPPIEVPVGLQRLDAGVRYTTFTNLQPVLRFTPPEEGWTAVPNIPCAPSMGSLRLVAGGGRMFVVYTPQLTVDEAVEMLLDGNVDGPVLADTSIGRWVGTRISAHLPGDIEIVALGSRSQARHLLPYHLEIEDVLQARALRPGDPIDIHVVDAASGVLTVVVTADESAMPEFRRAALALADTLELDNVEGAAPCN
jgi:hypothetical protein